MIIKRGVIIKDLHYKITSILFIVDMICLKYEKEGVITSQWRDPNKYPNSLHPKGKAIDIRSNHFKDTETKKKVHKEIKDALGSDYDVILEFLNKPNEHIHIEYDPDGTGVNETCNK